MQATAPHSCTICKYPLYSINNQFYCCNLGQRYCTICRGKNCIRCNKQIEKIVQLPKCRMCYNKYEDQLLYEPVCQCYYCAKCIVTQFFTGRKGHGEFCTFSCGHRMRVQVVEEFVKGRFCLLCGKKAQTIADYELITGDRCCFQCFRWDKKKISDLIIICLGCQKTLKRKAQIGVFNQGVLLCDLCAKQSYLQQERVQKIQQSRKKEQQSFHSSNRGMNNPDAGINIKTEKLQNNFIGQQPNQNYNQQNRFYSSQSNSQNPQLGQKDQNQNPYKIIINQSSIQPQKPKTNFKYSNPPNYNNSPNPIPSTSTSNPANINNSNNSIKPATNPVNSQQPVNIIRNTDQIGSIRSPPKSPKSPKKQSLSKQKDKNRNKNVNSQTNSTNTSSNTIANTVKDNTRPSQSREKPINQNTNLSYFPKNNDKQPDKSSQFQQVESVLQFQQVHTASYSSKPSNAQTVHANVNANKPNTLSNSSTSMTVSASTPTNSQGNSNIPSALSKTATSPFSSNSNINFINQLSNPNIYMQNIQNSKRTVLQRFPSEKDDGLNPNSPTYPAKRGIKKHLSMDTFVEKMKIDINIDQEVQSNIRVCKECGYQLVKDQCFTIQNSMHNIDTYCKLCYTVITNSQALGFNMQRTMLDKSRNTRGLSNQKHKIPTHLQKSISSSGNGYANVNQPLVSKSPQAQPQIPTSSISTNLLSPNMPSSQLGPTAINSSNNNHMKLSGNFQTHQRMTANVRVSDTKSMYREECVQCGSSGQALIRTGDRGSICFSCYYKGRGK